MNDKLIRLAIAAGAKNAAIIQTEDIVLSSVFRDICASNTCGKYGRCWMCPPDIGEIDALMSRLKGYEKGLLYQTIYAIEDSFDIEGMGEAATNHARVSQAVNDAEAREEAAFVMQPVRTLRQAGRPALPHAGESPAAHGGLRHRHIPDGQTHRPQIHQRPEHGDLLRHCALLTGGIPCRH